MTILHILEPDMPLRHVEWTGPTEFGCPKFKLLYSMITLPGFDKCSMIERVSVRGWPVGKIWHMLVDKDGLSKGLPMNFWATHLARVPIVGTALVWEGEME